MRDILLILPPADEVLRHRIEAIVKANYPSHRAEMIIDQAFRLARITRPPNLKSTIRHVLRHGQLFRKREI